ncbi:pyridoxamine 5'-phosphate oxidase [Nocardioides sp.]|uniref:pyridoxamine 5'-phosphate oxidase n=1 Tax=Nocardioides sp. TaxID=35761 RepID=UPI0035183E8C
MSIPVAVDNLAPTLADFDAAYLCTIRERRVKVVSVRAVLSDDGTLRVLNPGRGSVLNVADEPAVTLTFPPLTPGFSLLVDGTAVADGDDVVVTPTGAVLHKPAPPAPSA